MRAARKVCFMRTRVSDTCMHKCNTQHNSKHTNTQHTTSPKTHCLPRVWHTRPAGLPRGDPLGTLRCKAALLSKAPRNLRPDPLIPLGNLGIELSCLARDHSGKAVDHIPARSRLLRIPREQHPVRRHSHLTDVQQERGRRQWYLQAKHPQDAVTGLRIHLPTKAAGGTSKDPHADTSRNSFWLIYLFSRRYAQQGLVTNGPHRS